MIRIIIGGTDRQFSNFQSIDEGWLAREIQRHEKDGRSPCVRVKINHSGLNVTLSTGACEAGGSGGGRKPNRRESRTFDLWQKRGLNEKSVEPGDLISFLKKVRKLT